MTVNTLETAIANHSFRPAGIKVSADLWKELNHQRKITWVRGHLEGVIDSGINFPVLQGDIFVHVDPELDDFDYRLPSEPKK